MTLLAILCRELPRNVGCFDDDVFGVNVGCISFFAQENVRTRSPLRTLFWSLLEKNNLALAHRGSSRGDSAGPGWRANDIVP